MAQFDFDETIRLMVSEFHSQFEVEINVLHLVYGFRQQTMLAVSLVSMVSMVIRALVSKGFRQSYASNYLT